MIPTTLTRLTRMMLLAAIAATVAAPTVALANSNGGPPAPDWFERYAAAHPFGLGVAASTPPDAFDRYAANHTVVLTDGRSPDTRDAAADHQLAGSLQARTAGTAPDWFERYAAAHPFGLGVAASTPPDAFDRYAANHTVVLTDGRSADTRDAAADHQLAGSLEARTAGIAAAAHLESERGRFDWADAGIGAIFAFTFVLSVGSAMFLLSRLHRRPKVRTT